MSFQDQARQVIQQSGGRFTAQRRLIIDLIEGSSEHLDAERLYHLAHARDSSISLATVYRTLNVLQEAGLLDQRYLTREHERKYYEPVTAEEHYHFTCRSCHRVIEFESSAMQQLRRELGDNLHVSDLRICLCVEGLCQTCASASGEPHGAA